MMYGLRQYAQFLKGINKYHEGKWELVIFLEKGAFTYDIVNRRGEQRYDVSLYTIKWFQENSHNVMPVSYSSSGPAVKLHSGTALRFAPYEVWFKGGSSEKT